MRGRPRRSGRPRGLEAASVIRFSLNRFFISVRLPPQVPGRIRAAPACCGLQGIAALVHFRYARTVTPAAVACGESSLWYTRRLRSLLAQYAVACGESSLWYTTTLPRPSLVVAVACGESSLWYNTGGWCGQARPTAQEWQTGIASPDNGGSGFQSRRRHVARLWRLLRFRSSDQRSHCRVMSGIFRSHQHQQVL